MRFIKNNKLRTAIAPIASRHSAFKARTAKTFEKMVPTLNRYSIVFHVLLSCFLCLTVETISRRDLISAVSFLTGHSWAFLYNSFIIFATLSIIYLFRRRALMRFLLSGFWIFLGTINGCILSKRVTPFGYTDLKCIQDLLAMQNTNYFTAREAFLVVVACTCFVLFSFYLWKKGPKYAGQQHYIRNIICIAACCILLPVTTEAAQSSNVVASYFTNIAQGYADYGFVYGFSSSVVDRGMSKPKNYSENTIASIEKKVDSEVASTKKRKKDPNVIVVLLESFVDPYEINFLNCSTDPIPTFHSLEKNFSTGYLTVPVVGAGTANTEFEVLTGMSMEYFGTGEYPYKTILKQTDCESIASDLSKIGYGTHVVHNNTGNFYSRANAFSMMGFDSFTSKELMNITDITANGNWAKDNVLVGETIKALDSTKGSDFVYTITVQGHGDYPTDKILSDPAVDVTGADTPERNNQWEYYVNQIHEVDQFIHGLITELNKRNEDTMLVLFGDHLPSLGLTEDNMKSGSIFKTKYVTWNNFNVKKQDEDLTSYQLVSAITDQIGIHEGTIFNYHQAERKAADLDTYKNGLDNLQYDLLYGDRYAYNGKNLYPATDLVMGIDELMISNVFDNQEDVRTIYGHNFTPYTKIAVNGDLVSTKFISPCELQISADDLEDGDVLTANIYGSRSSLFRTSEEFTYVDRHVTHDNSQTPDSDK